MNRQRIIGVFSAVVLILAVIGIAGYQAIESVRRSFETVTEDISPSVIKLQEIRGSGIRMVAEALTISLLEGDLEEEIEEEIEEFEESNTGLRERVQELRLVEDDEEDVEFITIIEQSGEAVHQAGRALILAKQQGADEGEVQALVEALEDAEGEFETAIDQAIEIENEQLVASQQTAASSSLAARSTLAVFSVLAVLLAVGLGVVLDRQAAQQRTAEEQLEQQNRELVASNANLTIARREAEEATRLKDLFLATMSHELRTPLNAVIGFLGLMIYSEQLDDDNLHMAERSIENSNRLLHLINNILDLSRIASGRLEIVPGSMSPHSLVEKVREDVSFQLREKHLTLNVEMDDKLPETITHDSERITQILINLIGNAIKFTDEGGVTVNLARNDDRLVIKVTDTGMGIPHTKQAIIFDEFTQVNMETTRKHGGAGLGLSIVKRLAILMDGTVKVTSVPQQGSTFTVDLPLNLKTASAGQAVQALEPALERI